MIKLSPTFAFYLLSDTRRQRLRNAFLDAWTFVSGKTWWKFAAIGVCTALPTIFAYLVASILGLSTAEMRTLSEGSYSFHFAVDLTAFMAEVWATCAMVALVSASSRLSTRNLEAALKAP